MRISNPTSFAGDQPLATRKYVIEAQNAVLENIKDNSELLSGMLDANTSMLTGNISALENKIKKWLTGNESSQTGAAKGAGYAYLNDKTGKIDLSLMPPMSITKVLTAAQWEIELAWQNSGFPADDIIGDGKYAAVEAYLNQTGENGAPLHVVESGDIIVVTYYKKEPPPTDVTLIKNTEYNIDNSLVGPYIVTIPTYDTDGNTQIGDGKGVQVQKLSWPDANLISVNNKTADPNGNVNVVFADLLRSETISAGTIGQDLANAIFKIVPESVNTGRFALYELLPNNEGSPVAVPYAKLKEVTDLSGAVFERFTITDETIATLSASVYKKINDVDKKLTDNIHTLSANVFNEIDTVIGNADQAAAEGDYELIINNSVLSQLKRIYGDLTSITSDISTLSGNVDTLSGTVNANYDVFNTLKVTLKDGAAAGLECIETNWETSDVDGIKYDKVKVESLESVDGKDFIGGIDGIGTFNIKNLKVGQYIHTLKIPGDFQIVATYITENNEFRLVYPDVVYAKNANYISILSENSTVTGLPWKFFITKNILIK